MRASMFFFLAGLLACSSSGGGDDEDTHDVQKINWDGKVDQDLHPADARDAGPEAGPDAPVDGIGETVMPRANTPPTIESLPLVTLDMGDSTTVDTNPLLSDKEDPDSALVLSWSAKEVALLDPGDHNLLVVAPTAWFGVEVVDITVTDTGGLTATASLKVVVQEVTVKPPEHPCGETLFELATGPEAKEVLLSGTFNNWGADKLSATVMTDPDQDGTWSATLVLEPGNYLYKFVVDGKWMEDPNNPEKASDDYGGYNSVLTVPACEE